MHSWSKLDQNLLSLVRVSHAWGLLNNFPILQCWIIQFVPEFPTGEFRTTLAKSQIPKWRLGIILSLHGGLTLACLVTTRNCSWTRDGRLRSCPTQLFSSINQGHSLLSDLGLLHHGPGPAPTGTNWPSLSVSPLEPCPSLPDPVPACPWPALPSGACAGLPDPRPCLSPGPRGAGGRAGAAVPAPPCRWQRRAAAVRAACSLAFFRLSGGARFYLATRVYRIKCFFRWVSNDFHRSEGGERERNSCQLGALLPRRQAPWGEGRGLPARGCRCWAQRRTVGSAGPGPPSSLAVGSRGGEPRVLHRQLSGFSISGLRRSL